MGKGNNSFLLVIGVVYLLASPVHLAYGQDGQDDILEPEEYMIVRALQEANGEHGVEEIKNFRDGFLAFIDHERNNIMAKDLKDGDCYFINLGEIGHTGTEHVGHLLLKPEQGEKSRYKLSDKALIPPKFVDAIFSEKVAKHCEGSPSYSLTLTHKRNDLDRRGWGSKFMKHVGKYAKHVGKYAKHAGKYAKHAEKYAKFAGQFA